MTPGALETENALLRAALEAAAEAVVVADASGALVFRNRALGDVRATTLDELFRELFEGEELLGVARSGRAWEGRAQRRDGTSALVRIVPSPGVLLITMSDATELIARERHQQLVSEGEKVKTSVAWALSCEAPLDVRCAGVLATLMQFGGTGPSGAVYLRDPDTSAQSLFSYVGTQPVPRAADHHCAHALSPGDPRVVSCEDHGHYLVPLSHFGEELGHLVVDTLPEPPRDVARLEALGTVGELMSIALVRDRAEQMLKASRASAEDASRAKSDFLATMSHEIRTPMNGILGFSELLLETPLSDDQRGQLRLIRNSAEALLAVINDVLDYSKIEAGKFVIEHRPMHLRQAMAEPLELLRKAAGDKGVELEVEVEPSLPVLVSLDPLRFRQVLLNLVGNAVKFTSHGRVRVRATRRGDAFLVEVEDSGIGIAPEVLPRLFEKFVQADSSTSRRFGGTGLGLAISKRLVELMGGSLGARSEQGVGSTFFFALPLVPVVEVAREEPAARALGPLVRRRVLVAEDNTVNQALARRVLERLGCEVRLAANGREALDAVREQAPDLVLMDCQMPELDGYDATRAIRAWEAETRRARLPIVALTASAFADEVARCLDAGMDDVITKPFKPAQLEAFLREPAKAA
ncbi:MAG: ATP-binding protein [Myxococcota bacterium]